MMLRTSTLRGRATRALLTALAAVALSTAAAPAAHAQTNDEINQARAIAKDGFAAYKVEDYKKALVLFDQARKLYPSAQILRMAGYSYLALEQWEKAADLMDAAVAPNVVNPLENDDKKDVADNLAKAMLHLGLVKVTSDVDGAELVIDKHDPVKLPLDKPVRLLAGKHTILVRAPEHTDVTEEITVEPNGKLTDVKLSPKPIPKKVETPPPPPPPKPKPKPVEPPKGWIPMQSQIGLIAAGLGLGIGAGAVASGLGSLHLSDQVNADIQKHYANYGQNCDKLGAAFVRDCQFDREVINYDADRANTLANIGLGAGIAGGVLLAGGITLVLFAPSGPLGPKPKPAPTDDDATPTATTSSQTTGITAACAPLLTGGVTCGGTF